MLLEVVLIDLGARNFVHAKTSLRARRMHARHRARKLSNPNTKPKTLIELDKSCRLTSGGC